MAAQGGGSIINISSVGGIVPDISQVAYGTSKAASDDAAYTTGQILAVAGGFGLATPVYADLADKTARR